MPDDEYSIITEKEKKFLLQHWEDNKNNYDSGPGELDKKEMTILRKKLYKSAV